MAKFIMNKDVLTYMNISMGCVIFRLRFVLHDDCNVFFLVLLAGVLSY